MKLLCICDPTSYPNEAADVARFYRYVAGHPNIELYHLPVSGVFAERWAHIAAIQVSKPLNHGQFLSLNERPPQLLALSELDLVFCRTLKPFPAGYLQKLVSWEQYTRFVNRPSRKIEQISPHFFLTVANRFIPDAIATDNWREGMTFQNEFKTIIAKRANSCGGRGVFKIWRQNNLFQVDNFFQGHCAFLTFQAVMGYLQQNTDQPIQFFRYLPRTQAGDKRIIVVDGEIYGSLLRRSRSGHWVNNVSGDGDCIHARITKQEELAIANTVSAYQQRELHTLGYDFLMDNDGSWRLSEINAGNVGGFGRLSDLTKEPILERLTYWLIHFGTRQPASPPISCNATH